MRECRDAHHVAPTQCQRFKHVCGASAQPDGRMDWLAGIAALKARERLHRNPYFISAVFEADPPFRGHSLIGFGASVFVSAAFMDAEIATPLPDINSRLIASVHAGRSVVLDRADIARANAGPGLDVVIPYGTWRHEVMTHDERVEARTAVSLAFTELQAGYHLRRILWETASEEQEEFARRSGVYRAVGVFRESGRVLNLSDRQGAAGVPASLANVFFKFVQPVLGLRAADQELLLAAQKGATDAELAGTLGLQLAAVKARWRSVLARIAEARPELLGDAIDGPVRGVQKRHRVLAYIREHPQELRPYAAERMHARYKSEPMG